MGFWFSREALAPLDLGHAVPEEKNDLLFVHLNEQLQMRTCDLTVDRPFARAIQALRRFQPGDNNIPGREATFAFAKPQQLAVAIFLFAAELIPEDIVLKPFDGAVRDRIQRNLNAVCTG